MGVQIEKTETVVIKNELDEKSKVKEAPIYDIDLLALPPDRDGKYHLIIRPYFQMNGLRYQTETQYHFVDNPTDEYFLLLCGDLITGAQNDFVMMLRNELDNPGHLTFFPPVVMENIIERIKTAMRLNASN